MVVASLDTVTAPCVPNLHGAILGTRCNPFTLAMECNAGNVACVTLKCGERGGVGRADIKQLHTVMASCREIPLVWGDTQSVDL